MNIALSALIILLLILPGAIFRYSYARGSWGWSNPVSFRRVSDEWAYSAVFAVGLHFYWLAIVSCQGYRADYRALLALLLGNFGTQAQRYESTLSSVADHPAAIALYFLSISAFAAVSGRLAHVIVRALKLDLTTQVFRFENEWHYLLSGEVVHFRNSQIGPRRVDGVFLSAVVDHGKGSYLYRGLVEDWSFDKDGQLDAIRLRLAHRRDLGEDREDTDESNPTSPARGEYVPADNRYYEIRGDLFVIRYSQIKTLNLDYFELSEMADDAADIITQDNNARGDSPASPMEQP